MTFVYRSVAAVCPSWAGHIAAMPPLRGDAAQDPAWLPLAGGAPHGSAGGTRFLPC